MFRRSFDSGSTLERNGTLEIKRALKNLGFSEEKIEP